MRVFKTYDLKPLSTGVLLLLETGTYNIVIRLEKTVDSQGRGAVEW